MHVTMCDNVVLSYLVQNVLLLFEVPINIPLPPSNYPYKNTG